MARPKLEKEQPGVAARRAAMRLLDAVLRRGQALESALDGAARDLDKREDRAFAHAMAAEVLRRLPDLDELIDGATRQRLPDDAKARMALRLALVQALGMRTAPHAAISTVLPLMDGGPRKLVHGVFGTVTRSDATLPDPPTLPDGPAMRWQKAWGDEMLAAAARAMAAPPPIDITLSDANETDALATNLGGISLMPGHIRLPAGSPIPMLEGFGEGRWWVQDLAATLPARILGHGTGTALDLCAAPGGKTMQLASSGWTVTAVDSSESRLARLSENLDRTGLKAEIVAADLLTWVPDAPADIVLLDAPCSATGIFRRHPDVLHRVHPRVIREAAELQAKLLDRTASWVRPGGYLAYAVCSLEPEEGEQQVEAFLSRHPDFAIDPVLPDELPASVTTHQRGWLRTLPWMMAGEGGLDGFFIARLMRIA